ILTGGESRRMGKDKSSLILGGKTLLERTINLLSPFFGEIILSVSEENAYPEYDHKKVIDKYKGFGPLVGIYSSLLASDTNRNFIFTSDMPYLNGQLITFLLDYPSNKEIIIPLAEGKIHPLCGIYSRSILPSLESLIKNNLPGDFIAAGKIKSLSLKNFLDNQSVEYVDVEKGFKDYKSELFLNINTMEDYEKVRRDFEIN
ncbi:MAG: molybdenum cofactor guanylyltransferase, partial [Clostridiaceae bacterium]|nr:molybdenum cofactor guanylyltransferase [Clostridiaceae bacterium]